MNWFQFFVAALELPPDPKARQLWARLAHLQLIYSLAGLLVGLACIVGGLGLFLHGVYGSSSWVGDFIGVKSRLADAAPGTVLFVVGLLIVWLTRFSVKVRPPIKIELGAGNETRASRREHDRKRKAS